MKFFNYAMAIVWLAVGTIATLLTVVSLLLPLPAGNTGQLLGFLIGGASVIPGVLIALLWLEWREPT